MGGTLGVESDAGRGSVFWLELPVADRLEPRPRIAVPGNSPGTVGELVRGTVLYVEDDAANMQLVRSILARRPGVHLLSATHGEAGWLAACEHRPDLIFLDLHLPDLGGEKLLLRLRDDGRTQAIPVVVLSADALPAQIDRLRTGGASYYLTKPLDVAEFLRVLDEILTEDH